jgi:class 3 adenylate cyclase/cold shock CspA family protein
MEGRSTPPSADDHGNGQRAAVNKVPQLREAFAAEESRVEVTTIVIDMANATEAKVKQSEAAWLSMLGWFYDTATSIATRVVPNVVVKYIGDGLMLVCSSDEATQAIVATIMIQEAIRDANGGPDGAKGTIDFNCYAAITTGKAVEFVTPSGSRDFVGSPVDKAHRLCGAANEKAILIDRATASAANMGKVTSHVGKVLKRTTEEYQGDLTRVMLKGFGQAVEYYEFLWDQQRFSVNAGTVTANTDRMRPMGAPGQSPDGTASTARNGREERRHGKVKCWFQDRGFGFVLDDQTGEEFHFTGNALVYPEDLQGISDGDVQVAFVAQGAPAPGKRRRAGSILLIGHDAEGVLVSLPPARPYGWIRVQDALGSSHLVYLYVNDNPLGYKVGDLLSFRVAAGEKGTYAADVTRVDGEAAA